MSCTISSRTRAFKLGIEVYYIVRNLRDHPIKVAALFSAYRIKIVGIAWYIFSFIGLQMISKSTHAVLLCSMTEALFASSTASVYACRSMLSIVGKPLPYLLPAGGALPQLASYVMVPARFDNLSSDGVDIAALLGDSAIPRFRNLLAGIRSSGLVLQIVGAPLLGLFPLPSFPANVPEKWQARPNTKRPNDWICISCFFSSTKDRWKLNCKGWEINECR